MIRTWLKISINLAVILFAINALCLNILNKKLFLWWCHEDGIVENLQTIFYFSASVVFFYLSLKNQPKNMWHIFWCLLLFFMAGEEISWGQRIFGVTTPKILYNINVQHETNIHNIHGIHEHIRFAGSLFILFMVFFVPITNKLSVKLKDLYSKWYLPIFPIWACGIMFLALIFMLIPRIILHVKDYGSDEVGELFVSASFLLFSLSILAEKLTSQISIKK